MEPRRRTASILFAMALFVGGPGAAQKRAALEDVPAFAERVAELVAACSPGRRAESELFQSLSVLRPVPVPTYFTLLERGSIPKAWGDTRGTRTLRSEQRAAVRSALLSAPGKELRRYLDARRVEGLDDASRRLGLELIGAFGERQDLRRAVEYATVDTATGTVPRPLRQALRATFVAILARDGDAFWGVRDAYDIAPTGLTGSIVRALGASDPDASIVVASQLLGRVPAMDPLVLGTIGRLAENSTLPVEVGVTGAVRAYLFHPNSGYAQIAAKTAGQLEDYEAIPSLIRLLDEVDENLRKSAASALTEIVRVELGDAEAWRVWYDRELRWWELDGNRTSQVAIHGEPADALQAILELSRKRLFRHDLAAALAPAAMRSEEPLAMTVCAVLETLESPAAVPGLLEALDHDSLRVREAAAAALRRITGRDLPTDQEAWSLALEGR